jgi:multidrug efflux pump subunit AcrA (membrane-fusion protein)
MAAMFLALALAGCVQAEREEPGHEASRLQLFEEGKGVRLPEEMRRELGIATVEVREQPMASRLERVAKVFRAGDGSQPAAAVAFLDPADALGLRPGQPVLLRPNSGPEAFAGSLTLLDVRLTNVLGRSEATIEFADPAGRHPVASILTAVFAAARTNAVPVVPSAAVLSGIEGSFVYTISGSHFVRTPVRTGARAEEWVEIEDGLYAGDAVVEKGAHALWLIELCALKGGSPCCPAAKKPGHSGD